MNRLRLIISSSQRRLAAAVADNLFKQKVLPLEHENIVVLSNGMARWLSMELAAHHGVSAGLRFSFPNDLLDSCFRSILSDTGAFSPFTPDAMTWSIAALLPELAKNKEFDQISAYLGDGGDDRRTLQISRVIADTFDQYTIFRPEMMLEWDKGNGDGWQPILWRAVSSGCRGTHRAALLDRFSREIIGSTIRPAALPRRISLFGISYLPPFHLEALRLLSAHCDVSCYLLNPCGQYWGNIISNRDMATLALRSEIPMEALEYYETGNPLLSSLGTLGQEFFETVLEYGFECEELDDDAPKNSPDNDSDFGASLLAVIQSDILTLYDRHADGTKYPVPVADRSLQIHSCHGPMREMEILYDNLLAMFDELDNLEPRQIVVMIPDIESYSAYISAVFGGLSGSRPTLPYTIADRSVRRESPFIESFLGILELSSSRFGVNEVIGFLENTPVMNRFNITDEELLSIRSWLHSSGIRWGLDGEHRMELGFPNFGDFSWQAGLDRLFLGYAMTQDPSGTFKDILPYPGIGGRQTLALGKLAEFIRNLRHIHSSFSSRHTLSRWEDILSDAASRMLAATDNSDNGPTLLAKALGRLSDNQLRSGFNRPIAMDAVRDILIRTLAGSGGGYGFMGGGVTFCSMLPMRSIPMRVVCLAGMNDSQFPRTSRQPGFSLMSGARRRGDRSLRDEDRYLFLEALMSAGERFYISYDGQSKIDNSPVTPSILVSELQDYVSRCFVSADDGKTPKILSRHRLQGFSEAYFGGSGDTGLFSYDSESFDALEARRLDGLKQRIFLAEPLLPDTTLTDRIDILKLKSFLSNPAAAFLRNRLKISPLDPAEEQDEREPFSLDRLSGFSLSQELVGQIIAGASKEDSYSAARSRCILPPLSAGKAAFDAAWHGSSRFADFVGKYMDAPLDPLDINLDLGAFHLCGVLNGIQTGSHLRWRCASLKGKDRLSIWIDHLLLNTIRQDGYPRNSMMISSDLILEMSPMENAREILTDLLELYAEGMQRPLRFFPQSSWIFLNEGMGNAEKHWVGDQNLDLSGESANPSIAFTFGDEEEPLGEEFCRLASRVYTPIRNIAVELKRV
jgi:exodeoxyribonuclease V gamma subunit